MAAVIDLTNNPNNEIDEYEPIDNFEPVVQLPLVKNVTHEEDERAKLYRFDTSITPSEWKERGTGEVKLLHNSGKNTLRVVMRRDKTLKLCANHFVTPSIQLQRPDTKRKNWWMWSVATDFADEVSKSEIFAIKFASDEMADKWKHKFEEGQDIIKSRNVKEEKCKNNDDLDSESDISSLSCTEESYEDTSEKSELLDSVSKLDLNK